MTTIQIELPDALAKEATNAGLFNPEAIEQILRARLKEQQIERLKKARASLAANPLPEMSPAEINAEIQAYRSEQRRAAGS
jgi:hypothetical protein